MEPLQTWWATELYPSKDEDTFGVAGDFEVVRAADAQATIAALQARVKELEAIKIPDDAFTYCAYCGEKSPVDEHNEDLSAHIKGCPKHPMRDVESQLTQRTAELHETQNHLADADNEVEQLRKQLSERTAELEAVSNFIGVQYDAETRTWVSGQAPYLSAGTTKQEACVAAVDALRLACATWETKYRDLQAELERVRALIKALPKVEGDWTVSCALAVTVVTGGIVRDISEVVAAIVQHRQGMEG